MITNVADESDVDQPTGSSILSFVAPLAVTQAAGTVLGGSPARLTGRACFAIALRERKQPVRFCNRYVSDQPDALGRRQRGRGRGELGPARGAASSIDGYKASPIHVSRHRGARRDPARPAPGLPAQACACRAGRGPAQRVRATLTLRHVRGTRSSGAG